MYQDQQVGNHERKVVELLIRYAMTISTIPRGSLMAGDGRIIQAPRIPALLWH